jgi:hypothetical protein
LESSPFSNLGYRPKRFAAACRADLKSSATGHAMTQQFPAETSKLSSLPQNFRISLKPFVRRKNADSNMGKQVNEVDVPYYTRLYKTAPV